MNRVFVSIILAFIVIGGLLIFQASQQGTALVLLPSQLVAEDQGGTRYRIRIAGRVSEQPYHYQVEPKIELRFAVRDPGKEDLGSQPVLPVVYNGIKPDMFAAGRDVIVDGEFREGVFFASKLLTQCPSKYEPPDPVQQQAYQESISEQVSK